MWEYSLLPAHFKKEPHFFVLRTLIISECCQKKYLINLSSICNLLNNQVNSKLQDLISYCCLLLSDKTGKPHEIII